MSLEQIVREIPISLEPDSRLLYPSRSKVIQCMVESCGFACFDYAEFIKHKCAGVD